MYNSDWSPDNVTVSGTDLSLIVTNPTGRSPIGAEIRSTRSGWGYGTYATTVLTRFDSMPRSVIFGNLFTYDFTPDVGDQTNEIDIGEISAWGVADAQPSLTSSYKTSGQPGNVIGYNIPLPQQLDVTTHVMDWEPGRIRFQAFRGRNARGRAISSAILTGAKVPVPRDERVVFNLWVTDANGNDEQSTPNFAVTIGRFRFRRHP
ncbi:hypothetical protein GCM10009616_09690 [Microlunatus lacustris]